MMGVDTALYIPIISVSGDGSPSDETRLASALSGTPALWHQPTHILNPSGPGTQLIRLFFHSLSELSPIAPEDVTELGAEARLPSSWSLHH